MIKVALYVRVSKFDGSQSTERQIDELWDFAEQNKWSVIEVVEEHISGSKTNRSGTQRLINLAKANHIQKVLIHEVSRLGRNMSDTYNTVEALANNKVSVFDYQQKLETLDLSYRKTIYANIVLPILAGLSEQWLTDHKYRIKSGIKNAKNRGVVLGRPKGGKIKKEDDIIKLRKEGNSYLKIAKMLNISTATVHLVCKKHHLSGRLSNQAINKKKT